MLKYNTLIYENDPASMQRFVYFCKQIGMNVFIAENKDQAENIIKETYLELAIINISLDKISFSSDTKVITTGIPSKTALFDKEHYRSKEFITKPLMDQIIQFKLIRASGFITELNTFPSNITKFLSTLRNLKFQMNSISKDENFHKDFDYLASEYCVNTCEFGINPSNIEGDLNKYKTIAASSARGPILCKFKDTCMLSLLDKHLKETNPRLSNLTPNDILKNIELSTQQHSLTETIRTVYETYNETIQFYIETKNNLCLENCITINKESKDHKERTKTFCCEGGCVLDNYFNLTPSTQNTNQWKALIYMNQCQEAKTIEHYCHQLNIKTFCADNTSEAQKIAKNNILDVAIIDYELDKIRIPSNTNIVVIGKPIISAATSIMTYLPISFIPTPLNLSSLSAGIIKAMDIFLNTKTLFAYLSNISNALETNYMRLNNFVIDDSFKLTFRKSCSNYCETFCEFAATKDDIENTKLKDFEAINLLSKRGPLYCNRKKTCPLFKYQEMLESKNFSWYQISPSEIIQKIKCSSENFSIINKINEVIASTEGTLKELEHSRLEYCTKICPEKKNDLEFSKKDNLFSSFTSVFETNKCAYCTYHNCPLNNFFEFSKKTIL